MSFKNFLGNTLGAAGAIAGGIAGGPAGGAIGGAAGDALGGYFKDQSSLDSQIQQMKYQHELNKQMFDYVAEYNTPDNQRKRLEAAGLNPLLLYGQLSSGSVTSVPQSSGVQTPIRGAAGALGSLGLTNSLADANLKQSQADLNYSMREKTQQEFTNLVTMNNKLKEELQYFLDTKDMNMDILKEKLNQALVSTSYDIEELQQLKRMNPIAYEQAVKNIELTEENVKLLQATQNKLYAETKNLYADLGLKDRQMDKFNAEINNLYFNGQLTKENIRMAAKKADIVETEKNIAIVEKAVHTIVMGVVLRGIFKTPMPKIGFR